MLQTSSNQHDSNHLVRTPVTNVVNLSPKTTIFSEKALGLTTFVTTRQKATRKTPWIDDVRNNTHPSTPKTQHARPPMTPTGSGGPGCGARGWRRGLAELRADAPSHTSVHQDRLVWWAPEGPAAVPVGGGGAWPGFETTRRAKLAARTTRGRAAAHRHTQRPGPPAPGTPAASQATPSLGRAAAPGAARSHAAPEGYRTFRVAGVSPRCCGRGWRGGVRSSKLRRPSRG